MKSFVVLDQNFLRKEELARLIEDDPLVNFVLADATLLEMCKSADWEKTIRGSLALLAKCPTRVHAAIAIGEAFRLELATLRSAEGRMLSRTHRDVVRDILAAISSGAQSNAFESIARNYPRISAELYAKELDHVVNKANLAELIETLRISLGAETFKGLRNGNVTRTKRLQIMADAAPHLMGNFFSGIGVPSSTLQEFMRRKPLILRQLYAKLWLCLNWLARSGFESVLPNKITNDVVDLEYAVVATFFNGIKSNDHRVNQAYDDLLEILRIT